ncbi:hypothetical protein LCGC14_1401850 [marine sediment metagenome]|uniref:Uncharacterized protein n=1 Tax=marine sediment metagenome TaxID=412755 RepID=A0A0F9MCF6_9ZZZZ
MITQKCYNCHGSGSVNNGRCQDCVGHGNILHVKRQDNVLNFLGGTIFRVEHGSPDSDSVKITLKDSSKIIISRDEEGETHIRLVFHTRNRPAGSMPIKQVLGMTLSNSEFQDLKGEES